MSTIAFPCRKDTTFKRIIRISLTFDYKYVVHAALNHIDDSMKVTDIYIERDFVNENKANDKVVRYVFGK